MSKFKPGDRVKCINKVDVSSCLTLSRIYTVVSIDGAKLILNKDDKDTKYTDWYMYRFVKANKKNLPKEIT
jgi:hypothetical protein